MTALKQNFGKPKEVLPNKHNAGSILQRGFEILSQIKVTEELVKRVYENEYLNAPPIVPLLNMKNP